MVGQTPDMFLGKPDTMRVATSRRWQVTPKILFFGDLSRFVMREALGLTIERSTDLYFDKAQLAMRAQTRIDSAFVDTTAGVLLHQVP